MLTHPNCGKGETGKQKTTHNIHKRTKDDSGQEKDKKENEKVIHRVIHNVDKPKWTRCVRCGKDKITT